MTKIETGSKVKFYSSHHQRWLKGTIIGKWVGTVRYNVLLDETKPGHAKNVFIREDKLFMQ